MPILAISPTVNFSWRARSIAPAPSSLVTILVTMPCQLAPRWYPQIQIARYSVALADAARGPLASDAGVQRVSAARRATLVAKQSRVGPPRHHPDVTVERDLAVRCPKDLPLGCRAAERQSRDASRRRYDGGQRLAQHRRLSGIFLLRRMSVELSRGLAHLFGLPCCDPVHNSSYMMKPEARPTSSCRLVSNSTPFSPQSP